ncbi:hypothetical protein ABH920_006911 [Catenulispora sp. EB89]
MWADSVHLKVRLDEAKARVLVLISVRADGSKELIAMDSGYRESGESWASLLRDAKRRGMRAPILAVGDGALGCWKALRQVFPDTREQRCWVHKTANVFGQSSQVRAAGGEGSDRRHLQRRRPGTRRHGDPGLRQAVLGEVPKAVAKIVDNEDVLLAF